VSAVEDSACGALEGTRLPALGKSALRRANREKAARNRYEALQREADTIRHRLDSVLGAVANSQSAPPMNPQMAVMAPQQMMYIPEYGAGMAYGPIPPGPPSPQQMGCPAPPPGVQYTQYHQQYAQYPAHGGPSHPQSAPQHLYIPNGQYMAQPYEGWCAPPPVPPDAL